MLLQVRGVNRGTEKKEAARQGGKTVRFGPLLSDILGRMDKMVLVRSNFSAKATAKNPMDYLGRTKTKLSGTVKIQAFDEQKLKRGQFVYYKDEDDFVHSVCISNLNPNTNEVVILTREKKSKKIEIDRENSAITDKEAQNDDNLAELSIDDCQRISWRLDNIKRNRVIILQAGNKFQLIRCKTINQINNLVELDTRLTSDEIYGFPSVEIFYTIFEYKILCIGATAENTKIIQDSRMPSSIPYGLEYEPPLRYTDYSLRSRRDVDACPCTFLAMFQYESSGHDTKTSIKRYFTNTFDIQNQTMRWRVFCGRYFYFLDEDEEHSVISRTSTEGSIASRLDSVISEEVSNTPISLPDDDPEDSLEGFSDDSGSTASPSRSGSDASGVEGLPDQLHAGRTGSGDSQYSTTALINDRIRSGTTPEEMLTSTQLLLFRGKHYRVFINIFIIFQHWARHDEHKNNADRALWDPSLGHDGFDAFYPRRINETRLRPWMFTVTQALRDWICDAVTCVVRQHGSGTFWHFLVELVKKKAQEGEDITSDLAKLENFNRFRENLYNAMGSLVKMFDETSPTFRQDGNPPQSVTPIFAAKDWKTDNYDKLTSRAQSILSLAFKQAFPIGLDNGIPDGTPNGFDFEKYKEEIKNISIQASKETLFFRYITENLTFMLDRNKDGVDTLTDKAINAMMGTYVKKDSVEYNTIKQHKHTPILFPGLLKPGDMLAIYSNEGCTICKFCLFKDSGDNNHFEQQSGMNEGKAAQIENNIQRRRFTMRHRHICFKLSEDDDPEENFIENSTNAYLLTKKTTVQPAEE